MSPEAIDVFPGFPDFRANVTFVPLQFFTVVVPHCSRGTVRIVGYALRKLLGWVDQNGNPTREQLRLTYRELVEGAGVSRECIADALREAIERHLLRCLQEPRPDQASTPAQSGIYELCWDNDGDYSNDPHVFNGFYYPEAAVLEFQDGARTVRRPRSARKNIPNAFFDYLLPRERLSVIRVVGALLFYSIQWGPGGERKVPVRKSITELSRLTRMTRRHVHQAVHEAQQRGYIELAEGGFFDRAAGVGSRAATYAIRWDRSGSAQQPESNSPPVGKGNQSEKGHGEAVRKGVRTQSEIGNRKESEMGNGIRIKKELKKEQATGALAAGPAYELLRQAGFDRKAAEQMAARYPQEVIQRQLQWLPCRSAARSRLGLLRRAIEEDWPKQDSSDTPDSSLARLFASHYYAGYHGYSGEAATEPFVRDLELAAKFIPRLLNQEHNETLVSHWGRRFGQLMREKHQNDSKARPNLSFALVLYGDQFLQILQREWTARQKEAIGKAREAHYKEFAGAYLNYLRCAESRLKEGNPALYESFVTQHQRVRKLLTNSPFLPSAERLAQLDSEANRLSELVLFFKDYPQKPVLGFWEWDKHFNPEKFMPKSNNSQEAQP